MQFKAGNSAEDVDEMYAAICKALDNTPEQSKELYLARLCLLLIGEFDKKDYVMSLIDKARIPSGFYSSGDNDDPAEIAGHSSSSKGV